MYSRLIRSSCLLLGFLGIIINSIAQTEMPMECRIPLQLSLKEYTYPKLFYGVKPCKGTEELFPDIFFRNFKLVYDAGFLKKPASVPYSEIIVGFIGFKREFIDEVDTLWCKPSDTTIQPFIHNLLSDVFLDNLGAFDAFNPESCSLCVVHVQSIKSPGVTSSVGEKGQKIIFLLWNKEKQPVMPAFFPSNDMTCMPLTKPLKFQRNKALAQRIPPPAVNIAVTKETITPIDKPILSTEKKALEETKKVVFPPDSVTFAPKISALFIPEIVTFLKKKNFSFNDNEMTLSLSKTNDTLIVSSKNNGNILKSLPILVRAIPFSVEQAESNRRLGRPDAESKFLNARQSKKLVICYKGQGMFVNPAKKMIFIPEIITNPDEILAASSLPASVKVVKNISNTPDSIKIFFDYEKNPLKLLVYDQKSQAPVNGFHTEIWYSQKIKVFDGKLNSGNEIPGLFLGDSLYTMLIYHPDYKNPDPASKIFITRNDFIKGKTVSLEPQPGFNIIYVEPKFILRQNIVECLEERTEEIIKNHQPFLLFVSNTSNPMIVSDPDKISETVNRIPELFDDPTNPDVDYSFFSDNLKRIEGLQNKKIILQFYCSIDFFRNGGNAFMLKIINDLLKGIFNNENTEIWMYTNGELTYDEKNSLLNYHYYQLMKE